MGDLAVKAGKVDMNRLTNMGRQEKLQLMAALTPKITKYSPHQPYPKQLAFLLLECREAFYGGAAGGGKSDALLMAALQYVDVPGYAAILFRKSYADLTLPGALMTRAAEWLQPYVDSGEVHWNDKTKTYLFHCPGGGEATLSFGFLDNVNDKYKYQGAEFQFVGFDEVTQIVESNYRYLFSRLRRLKGTKVPLRVRGASNPGGIGHEWVKRRFLIEGPSKGRVFIPANMKDNLALDVEEYNASLDQLDPITREQLKNGDWEVKTEGSIFHRDWFGTFLPDDLPTYRRKIRWWDMAATEASDRNKDPDYTVGFLLSEDKGNYYIEDIQRVRKRPAECEKLMRQIAEADGTDVFIRMEQEPGSSGVITVDHFARTVFAGFSFQGVRSTGSKALRAAPASSAAEQHRVFIRKNAVWVGDFFDELEVFPFGEHDDQVDGFSGSFNAVKKVNMMYLPVDVGGGGDSYWDVV